MAEKELNKEKLANVLVGAGLLGLVGLAVGTETGRGICTHIASRLNEAEKERAERELDTKRVSVERSKMLLDLELELATLRAKEPLAWRKADDLEARIEVLKRAIERGY